MNNEESKMPKNYKSWFAFVTFLSAFAYSVFSDKPEPIVYTTGLFFVVITIAFMLRSEELLQLMKIVIERFKK